MTVLMTIDAEGRPTGFYVPEIHGNAIPSGAIEITEAQWREALSNQGRRLWNGSALIECDLPPSTPLPIELIGAISRRQFAKGLAHHEFVAQEEAEAFLTVGTLPAAFATMVASLPPEEQFDARMDLQAATFERNHPLVSVFGSAQGMTEVQIDDFWHYCWML
ncbi:MULTISPECIES: hypothetical protein [unclassified Beijerinckia]|uniref:hypothetical protein n=1 Tax=unclassified Beijerinckia TaxID=2638183 RepID=UPI00089782D0|nr:MULTISPECIES: hypothetical protein [unclassified Beijerinckia]MDH7796422.1 hypothetical protein [Beijerinckia sp. GAS462]SEC44418.1 hypothetical protein SAMN05443249_2704 [Beijerinckia sp. 28-YEA-48]